MSSDTISLMRLRLRFFFLTLVVFLYSAMCIGGTQVDVGHDRIQTLPVDNEYPLKPTRNLVEEAQSIGGELRMGKKTQLGVLYQRQVPLPNHRLSGGSLNMGATLTTDFWYGAHVDYQWLLAMGSYYEPVARVGFGGFFAGSEEFGSFIKFERYQLRLSSGFEDLFNLRRKLRAEAVLAVSTGGVSFALSCSWAFQSFIFW